MLKVYFIFFLPQLHLQNSHQYQWELQADTKSSTHSWGVTAYFYSLLFKCHSKIISAICIQNKKANKTPANLLGTTHPEMLLQITVVPLQIAWGVSAAGTPRLRGRAGCLRCQSQHFSRKLGESWSLKDTLRQGRKGKNSASRAAEASPQHPRHSAPLLHLLHPGDTATQRGLLPSTLPGAGTGWAPTHHGHPPTTGTHRRPHNSRGQREKVRVNPETTTRPFS